MIYFYFFIFIFCLISHSLSLIFSLLSLSCLIGILFISSERDFQSNFQGTVGCGGKSQETPFH